MVVENFVLWLCMRRLGVFLDCFNFFIIRVIWCLLTCEEPRPVGEVSLRCLLVQQHHLLAQCCGPTVWTLHRGKYVAWEEGGRGWRWTGSTAGDRGSETDWRDCDKQCKCPLTEKVHFNILHEILWARTMFKTQITTSNLSIFSKVLERVVSATFPHISHSGAVYL